MKTKRIRAGWIVAMALAAGGAAGADLDHTHEVLTALLKAHVTEGWVDYGALSADRGRLDAYLAELAAPMSAEFDIWSADRRLAYWLNAYNAFVLASVVDNYPIRGRSLVGLAFPKNSVWQIGGIWKNKRHRVAGGQLVSLDQIENEIIRKRFAEPRIHFALVCASLGCPDLPGEAFRADHLEEQLEERTRRFLNDPVKGVRLDGNRVQVSKIFKWFDEDFQTFADDDTCFSRLKQHQSGPLSFAGRYRPDLATLECGKVKLQYLDYDWRLNDLESAI